MPITDLSNAGPSQARLLHRLFLILFLRGRTARGVQKSTAPGSMAAKLGIVLASYSLVGASVVFFLHEPVFLLSLYLHAMTFALLAVIVVASANESLFNEDEADVLLHRPVTPQALLRAKVTMLVQMSLWLAVAFNLVGFAVGIYASDGGWLYPFVHLVSTATHALFCTASVVLSYQLCLRWVGRERLEGLMSLVQVVVCVGIVIAGQMLPRLLTGRLGDTTFLWSWWMVFLPSMWFAGIDDALAGSGATSSWLLAVVALSGTAGVLWASFVKLAQDYETGLQNLSESALARRPGTARRFLEAIADRPPMRWWLRDSASRGAFVLTVVYLLRDRDTRLRVYPGLAPLFAMPFLSLTQGSDLHSSSSAWVAAFAGGFLGLIPMLALNLLRYSQQWPAADLFRAAPMIGPSPLWRGARAAVALVLTLPILLITVVLLCVAEGGVSQLVLLLPGIIALPIYSLLPCVEAKSGPLSMPTEAAMNVKRGIMLMGISLLATALSGLTTWAWMKGWFWPLVIVEAVLASAIYAKLHAALRAKRWTPME